MEKVKISDFLIAKLKRLSTTLYEKEYFGYMEDSEHYVNKIIDFMYTIP